MSWAPTPRPIVEQDWPYVRYKLFMPLKNVYEAMLIAQSCRKVAHLWPYYPVRCNWVKSFSTVPWPLRVIRISPKAWNPCWGPVATKSTSRLAEPSIIRMKVSANLGTQFPQPMIVPPMPEYSMIERRNNVAALPKSGSENPSYY